MASNKWPVLLGVGWLAAAAGLVLLASKMHGCDEATLAARAWKQATEIVKPDEPLDRPESVHIAYEPRFYLTTTGSATRVCGRTTWYILESSKAIGFVILPDVQIYVKPGDCDMVYDALVHEFIHVILAYNHKNGPHPDDEAWIQVHWPVDCR